MDTERGAETCDDDELLPLADHNDVSQIFVYYEQCCGKTDNICRTSSYLKYLPHIRYYILCAKRVYNLSVSVAKLVNATAYAAMTGGWLMLGSTPGGGDRSANSGPDQQRACFKINSDSRVGFLPWQKVFLLGSIFARTVEKNQ